MTKVSIAPAEARIAMRATAIAWMGILVLGAFLGAQQASAQQTGNSSTQATTETPETVSEEVTIYGKIDFFKPEESTSAAKMSLPILETPQSITVLSDEVLETFQVRDIAKVAAFVAGVENRSELVGERTGLTSRGFILDIFDGYKLNGISYFPSMPLDPIVLDRVEFVKGPSGIVFGRNSYGGAVNYITKKPVDSPLARTTVEVGTDSLLRLEADVATVFGDGRWQLRLPLAAERENSVLRRDRELIAAAPSLRFNASESTSLLLVGLLQDWRENLLLGYSPVAAGLPSLPFDPNDPFASFLFDCTGLSCGPPPESYRDLRVEPQWNGYDTQTYQWALTLDHALSDMTKLVLSATTYKSDYEARQGFTQGIAAANGDHPIWGDRVAFEQDGYSVEAAWTGDFEAWGSEHTFYVGADYRKFDKRNDDTDDPFIGVFNIFDLRAANAPDARVRRDPYAEPNWVVRGFLDDDREYTGFGAQTLLRFGPQWSLLVGGRYETAKIVNTQTANGPASLFQSLGAAPIDEFVNVIDKSHFVPRVGLNWQPLPERFSVYASYAEGYVPQFGRVRGGAFIDPEEGAQIELGAKAELFDKRLLLTFAAFEIDRTGVSVRDPSNLPGESFRVGGLEQENRGVEFEAIGKPLPGLNILFNASWIEAEFTADASGNTQPGTPVVGVPEKAAGAFATYEFRSGALQDFSFGVGASYVSDQVAGAERNVVLPSYTSVDLNAGYSGIENLEFRVIVENVLDEVAYNSIAGTEIFGLKFVPGRSARASLTYTF